MLPETISSTSPLLAWWRRWPVAVRAVLAVTALAFVAALVGSTLAYFQGDEAVWPWRSLAELQPLDVAVDSVRSVSTLPMPVVEPGYIVTQRLAPAPSGLNVPAAGWMLALLTLGLVGYLTILPGLGWRTFLAGAGLLTFFLSTLNLDLLGFAPVGSVFSQVGMLVSLAVLGGTAWVLHAFFPRVGPNRRIVLFAGLVLGLGAVAFWRSPFDAARTTLHLVGYGTAGLLGVSAGFILWVSFENIRALLWLTGQADNPAQRRGAGAFAIAAGLYLLNLLLLFLDAFGFVKFGGAFLNAFFVLLSSIISGLFGLRLREAEYGRVISYLLMAPLYLLLAALTLGTLGYAFATANDPLLEAFTDGIVITHLALGATFTGYVFLNFLALLQRRLRTYRVVFDPRMFPVYLMYVVGIGAIVFILTRQQFFLLRQFRAGYYNGLGDYYRATGDGPLADAYYQQADNYVPFNVKANTARAALANGRSEIQLEQNLLRRALRRSPTDKGFAALAATYTSETAFFDQQRVLREGLNKFPASPVLNLLMGTLYARTTITDSATFYFRRAGYRADRRVRQALLTNQLSLLLRHRDDLAAARLAREVGPADGLGAQANALLAGFVNGLNIGPLNPVGRLPDSLHAESFAWLNQRLLRQIGRHDTSGVQLLQYLADRPVNAVWGADLLELRALVLRAGGQAIRARGALLERAESGTGDVAARRYRTLGEWALEDGQPAQAAEWLNTAADRGEQHAFVYRVLALARAGRLDSARRAIPIIYTSGDPLLRNAARHLQFVLTAPLPVLASSDSLLADYVLLRGAYEPAARVDSVLARIGRPALRVPATAYIADYALTTGDVGRAARVLATAPPTAALRWLRAETAVRTGKIAQARHLLTGPPPDDPVDAAWHQYVTGLLAVAQQQPKAALRAFYRLPTRAPWLERGILAAADFLEQHPPKTDALAAYNALLVGVGYNRQSVPLWQAYALSCLRMGLTDFAEDALSNLARLQPAPEFAIFKARYDAARAQAHPANGFE